MCDLNAYMAPPAPAKPKEKYLRLSESASEAFICHFPRLSSLVAVHGTCVHVRVASTNIEFECTRKT